MLSPAAWNAFLKTLEEPPAARGLRAGDDRGAQGARPRSSTAATASTSSAPRSSRSPACCAGWRPRRRSSCPTRPIGMLARSATGSFRDALGTLEQLVTYGGKEVQLDDVRDILGVADAELVLDTAEALADRDPRAALLAVQRLSDSGRDFTQFMRDLSAHLRHLFVVQTLGEVPDSFSVTAEHTDRLAAQAERFSQGEILRAIDFLAAAIAAVKDGSEPRIQLEMALLKAHPAAGRPVAAGADVPHRAARGAARRVRRRAGRRRRAPASAAPGVRAARAAAPRARRPAGRSPPWRPSPRRRREPVPGRRGRPRAAAGDLARGGRGGHRGERDGRRGARRGAADGDRGGAR